MIQTHGPSRFAFHRPVDIVIAASLTLLLVPLLMGAIAAATISTRSNGIFRQRRIGRGGEEFSIAKLQTMRQVRNNASTVTTRSDARVTRFGRLARRLKIDEIPQLFNVLLGDMALLGPRPDVPGFADLLEGDDRLILEVRPGISGPATLLFRDEEVALDRHPDPERFSGEVLFPLKTQINLAWIRHGSLANDLLLLLWTIWPPPTTDLHAMLKRWDPALITDELAAYTALLTT